MTYTVMQKEERKFKVHKYCSTPHCKKRLKPNEQQICQDCRRRQQLRMRGY